MIYPTTLNATEARLLAIIQREGNWLADPKCLTHDDLEALEHMGYMRLIEKSSFGGYRVKDNRYTAGKETMTTLFIRATAAGIDLVTASGKLVTCAYVGTSTVARQCTIKYLRRMGYAGWDDPCAVSTSGGNGNSRYLMSIGRWDMMERHGV